MSQESAPPHALGLVGLGVMGRNLALNFRDHGVPIVAHDAYPAVNTAFEEAASDDPGITVANDLRTLAASLPSPRRILLMVKAGEVVDATLAALIPHLEPGDCVLDGGNSHYADTERRVRDLAAHGLHFLGVGVSGGEEGARNGPSLMPGGNRAAYDQVAPLLTAIAATAPDGEPCIAWLGEGGAGHFVKMVHNGIEYGDMQLIAEAYDLMRRTLGMPNDAMAATFQRWNEGPLESYLIDITRTILSTRDPRGGYVIDDVLDAAGEKGTGRWTAVTAFEQGSPFTVVAEAVAARSVSSALEERQAAAQHLEGPDPHDDEPSDAVLLDLHDAVYAAKIVAYAQGLDLIERAARSYGWTLDPADAAAVWRGGCIIRSAFLDDIVRAYRAAASRTSLLQAPFFRDAMNRAQAGLRRTVARAASLGVAAPVLAAALAYYDGYRTARGPANLIQAQRDYFGAHTFERISGERGTFEHFDWSGAAPNVPAER